MKSKKEGKSAGGEFKFVTRDEHYGNVKPKPKQAPPAHYDGGKNKGRPRVAKDQGDKVVSPAKSKPKKRKTVGQYDMNTLGMHSVVWTDTCYTVSELANTYRGHFPIVVRVTQGYYGEFGSELAIDQVLQIHSFGKQQRVVATNAEDKRMSIPYDYPVDVEVADRHTRERLMFQDAVRTKTLPFQCCVVGMAVNTETTTVNIVGEELYLRKIENDIFLRANSIIDGWIDQVEVHLVPSFVGAEFSVATRMRGASEVEWLDFRNMYSRSVRHLNFSLMTGYNGIVVDAESPYPLRISALDSPNDVKISPIPTSPTRGVYENITKTTLIDDKENRHSNVYDNQAVELDDIAPVLPPRGESKRHYTLDKSSPADPPRSSPSIGMVVETEVHHPPPDVISHAVPRPETPFNEDEDVSDMFENVIKFGEEVERLETLEREKRAREQQEKERLERDRIAQKALESHSRLGSTGADQPPRGGSTSNDPHGGSVTDMMNRFEGSGRYSLQHRRSYVTETPAGQPKAVVQPVQQQRKRNSSFSPGDAAKLTPNEDGLVTNIETIDDVPSNIEHLTVDDVCMCLKLLNMDGHINEFRRHQIDGGLLADIKDTVLIHEFKFTPFNASKLLRFSRGWRPKIM